MNRVFNTILFGTVLALSVVLAGIVAKAYWLAFMIGWNLL